MPWLNLPDDLGSYYFALHPFAIEFMKRRGWSSVNALADAVGVEASDLAYILDSDRGIGFEAWDLEVLQAIGFTLEDTISLLQPCRPALKLVRTGKRKQKKDADNKSADR